MKFDRRRVLTLGAAIAALSAGAAQAQQYPDKAIRVIYPFAAGGSGDALVRLFATAATPILGQQIIIDNRPGAGGNIGFAAAAKAPADGYTLLSVSPSFAINYTLYKEPGFDPVKDFVPVASMSVVPNVLEIPATSPFKSVKDLVDYAKANPGKLSFGSSGIGTSVHLAGELFKKAAGIDIVHVPYPTAGQRTTDIMAGRIDMMFESSPTALNDLSTGKVRSLTIANATRVPQFADVPTTKEAGYPDVISGAWTGFLAPAGTPKAIVDKLYEVFNKVTHDETVIKDLATKLGGQPFYSTPAEWGAFIKKEVETNGAIVKALNLKVE